MITQNESKYIIFVDDVRDYGCRPIGVDQFIMIPSGDVVDKKERDRRFAL